MPCLMMSTLQRVTAHTFFCTHLVPAVVVFHCGGQSDELFRVFRQDQISITGAQVFRGPHEEHLSSPRGLCLLLSLLPLLFYMSVHGQDCVIRATLPGRAADAQLWSVEVSESASAGLGGEPGRVELQGRSGVLYHTVVAVETAKSLGDGDVPGAVVFIIGERILFALGRSTVKSNAVG